MLPHHAVRYNGKWRVRLVLFLLLIFPLYLLPSLGRSLLVGWAGWGIGILVSDLVGCVIVGFMTNNYLVGVLLYLGSTALELSFILWSHQLHAAIWLGDLIPALVAIYFAQQLYINMGD